MVSRPSVDSVHGLTLEEPAPSSISGAALLQWRRRMLALGGAPAPLDWLLDLGGGLRWRRLQALWCHPDAPVRLLTSLEALEALWRRHLETHAPLQYLVGRCPWRDLDLTVGPGVLIPRQETELLVDLALSLLPPDRAVCSWADLGTGSGCLAAALARCLPHSRGVAVDVSPEALVQAGANLARMGLRHRVTLQPGDWWRGTESWWGRLDLVVANPPYIPTALLAGLDPVVRDHEPRLALDGGPDGLSALETIIGGACRGLAPGGLLLLEHHHDQSGAIGERLLAAGLERPGAHRDLEGRVRFASAWRPLQP